MPFVIDVSVIADWHFADERSNAGQLVLARLNNDTALVPEIWWFELHNVVLNGERRGRASQQQSQQFLEFARELPIEIVARPDERTALSIARRHQLSFYDACYVELAYRERLALATFDTAMARAATAEGVALIGVS